MLRDFWPSKSNGAIWKATSRTDQAGHGLCSRQERDSSYPEPDAFSIISRESELRECAARPSAEFDSARLRSFIQMMILYLIPDHSLAANTARCRATFIHVFQRAFQTTRDVILLCPETTGRVYSLRATAMLHRPATSSAPTA